MKARKISDYSDQFTRVGLVNFHLVRESDGFAVEGGAELLPDAVQRAEAKLG